MKITIKFSASLQQLLDTLVVVPAGQVLEPLQTLGARVRHLRGMYPRVAGKLLPLSETGATLLTLKIGVFFNLYIHSY